MSPLLAPVLAQLISLQVDDRTEARYVVDEEKRYEGFTRPQAQLLFQWRRVDLGVRWGTSFFLTPLESKPRDLQIFHEAGIGASYRLRHTSFGVSSTFGFGEVNFREQILRGTIDTEPPDTGEPAQPGQPEPEQPAPGVDPAQPGGAGTDQPIVVNRSVRYLTTQTSAFVTHQPTKQVQLGATTSYTVATGLNDAARRDYPLTRGYLVGASATHTLSLSARDSFLTGVVAQHVWSSNDNRAGSLTGSETWQHAFSRRTSSQLGAGLSISRSALADGTVAYSVYPNFTAGVVYQTLLARGAFGVFGNAYSSPALDPLRATVDPRLGVGGGVGWSRDRFSTGISGNAAISVAPVDADAGAVDSYQGAFVVAYRVADEVGVNAGARAASQDYQDTNVIPLTYAFFVGLDLSYFVRLKGNKPQ